MGGRERSLEAFGLPGSFAQILWPQSRASIKRRDPINSCHPFLSTFPEEAGTASLSSRCGGKSDSPPSSSQMLPARRGCPQTLFSHSSSPLLPLTTVRSASPSRPRRRKQPPLRPSPPAGCSELGFANWIGFSKNSTQPSSTSQVRVCVCGGGA